MLTLGTCRNRPAYGSLPRVVLVSGGRRNRQPRPSHKQDASPLDFHSRGGHEYRRLIPGSPRSFLETMTDRGRIESVPVDSAARSPQVIPQSQNSSTSFHASLSPCFREDASEDSYGDEDGDVSPEDRVSSSRRRRSDPREANGDASGARDEEEAREEAGDELESLRWPVPAKSANKIEKVHIPRPRSPFQVPDCPWFLSQTCWGVSIALGSRPARRIGDI